MEGSIDYRVCYTTVMLIILKTTVISFDYHEPKTQNTAFDILAILLKSHVCYLNKWTGLCHEAGFVG